MIKQDNNGTTFVISSAALPWLANDLEHATQVRSRRIGVWTHPTSHDLAPATEPGSSLPTTGPASDPPF